MPNTRVIVYTKAPGKVCLFLVSAYSQEPDGIRRRYSATAFRSIPGPTSSPLWLPSLSGHRSPSVECIPCTQYCCRSRHPPPSSPPSITSATSAPSSRHSRLRPSRLQLQLLTGRILHGDTLFNARTTWPSIHALSCPGSRRYPRGSRHDRPLFAGALGPHRRNRRDAPVAIR